MVKVENSHQARGTEKQSSNRATGVVERWKDGPFCFGSSRVWSVWRLDGLRGQSDGRPVAGGGPGASWFLFRKPLA